MKNEQDSLRKLEAVASIAEICGLQECDCEECQKIRQEYYKIQLEQKKGGKLELVIKLPFYREVEELISLRELSDLFNDVPIWKKIFAGNLNQFEKISECGKNEWRSITSRLDPDLLGISNEEERAAIRDSLRDESGKDLIALLWSKKGARKGLIVLTEELEVLFSDIDEKTKTSTHNRIEELLKFLPTDLQNAKEPPQLRIAVENLAEAIKTYNVARQEGFLNSFQLAEFLTSITR